MGEITAEEVLARVRAAGGSLVLRGLSEEERAGWRRAAKIAYLRLHRVGREHLTVASDATTIRIRLSVEGVQAEPMTPPKWSPPPSVAPRTGEFRGRRVPVPSKLTKPHPLAEKLIEAADVEGPMERRYRGYIAPMRRRPVQRMRRIWHALITETEFRGYRVRLEQNRRDEWDRGRLIISIGPDDYPITLTGGGGQPLVLRLEDEAVRQRKRDTWTDSADAALERQLGALLTRIEEHADEQVARRAAERRQLEERRRRWDEAAVAARHLFVEDVLRATIVARAEAACEVREMRAYGAALEGRATGLPVEDRGLALEWVAWIRGYADEIDPARKVDGIPVVAEPTDRDLRPYLERAGHSGWRP